LARHQNDLARGVDVADGAEHVKPVDVGHHEIDEHRIRLEAAQFGECGSSVGSGHDREPEALRELRDDGNTSGSSSIASSAA
jgi:hypothetical protein